MPYKIRRMSRHTALAVSVAAVLTGAAFAGGAGGPAAATLPHHYPCEGGAFIGVRYDSVNTNPAVTLRYQGRDYHLTRAPSASGARFVSAQGGLEWWEHQGEGTLSRYSAQSGDTQPLLQGCRLH